MKQILLIDPEKTTLELTKRFLENHGYKVITKSSASDALDRLLDPSLDLIITELEIQGLTGLDLCLISERYHSGVPIMVLTAKDDELTRKEAKNYGALDFISKQTEYSFLPHRVSEILHNSVPIA